MESSRTEKYVDTLAKLIRYETISSHDHYDEEKFHGFHELLKASFPHVFTACELEEFDGSLLFRWPGKSSEKPLMLMSHHDVVEATGEWEHPAFCGEVFDGNLWGRGTLDTKGNLWAMLQAAEELIEEGFVPEQDVWFESACNEEIGGAGADCITKELKRRGIRFGMVLDEGGMIMYDPIGGADAEFAMIGVGEKGMADLKFIARSNGGHASTPGKDTPLVRLGKFMAAVEKSDIFEAKMDPVIAEMFRRMAPAMKGPMKPLFEHIDKTQPVLEKVMPQVSATANALLRTTLAFTMAGGAEGRNVLPQEAYVVGNMRFSHHQGRKASIMAARKLAKKFDIETEILDPGFSSRITDFKSDGFKLVERAVAEVFPGVTPSPYLMTGGSDSRYYDRVCDCCLRFAPFFIDDQQYHSIHGIDENVSVDSLAPAVDFFRFIIKEYK